MPTGGVRKPSERFVKKMTPMWTGWMPNDSATGMTSGDTTRIAEYRSIRQPTTSSSMFRRNRNRYFECTKLTTRSVRRNGMPASIM